MSTCHVPVLNGACSNSEGGRLSRIMKGLCYKGDITSIPSDTSYCPTRLMPNSISDVTDTIVITPPESTRVNNICGGNSRRMTQDYVKKLLHNLNPSSHCETVSDPPITMINKPFFTSRFEPLDKTYVPTPPPPAPPAKACPLTKNQKMS